MDNIIKLLGVAIGGTKSAVTFGTFTDGKLIALNKTVVKTDPNDPDVTFGRIFDAIDQLKFGFDYIGIICGGPLDIKRGLINTPPNLPGFKAIPVCKMFTDRYNKPSILLNDADACAYAEWRFGAGVGVDNIIYLTCGTGFGAGLILNGDLFSGTIGQAGEIGHVRLDNFGGPGYGKVGSAEGFLSGSGIAKTAIAFATEYIQRGEYTSLCSTFDEAYKITAKDVAVHAKNGDACAKKVFDVTAQKLGDVLAILVDLFNPDRIVIGGVYQRNEDLLYDKAVARMREEALPVNAACVKILPSFLKEEIDDYSSLSAAVYAYKKYSK